MTELNPARAAIELRGVSKHYGTGGAEPVAAADNVSLTFEPGGLIALTGASGSGKSTLLHLIGAIERPDSGTIISGGIEVTALRGGAAGRLPAHGGLRVPALQPAARADRPGQRDRAGAPVPDRLGQAGPWPPAPGRGRPRRPGALAALPDVRR